MDMSIVPKETIGAGDAEYRVRQMMQDLEVEMGSFTYNETDCESVEALLAMKDNDQVGENLLPTMRILWSPEEVEMLKVCVEKFAPKVKRNLPWQKILLMGKDVFHESRTPSRLKDKWKTMKAKKKMLRGKDVSHEPRTPSRLKDKWKTMKAKKKMLRCP